MSGMRRSNSETQVKRGRHKPPAARSLMKGRFATVAVEQ